MALFSGRVDIIKLTMSCSCTISSKTAFAYRLALCYEEGVFDSNMNTIKSPNSLS